MSEPGGVPSVHQHRTSIDAYLGESAGHFVASKN
jgi:hypothetical protein